MNQHQFYLWLSQKWGVGGERKRKKNHTCFTATWHFKTILNCLNLIGDHSVFEAAKKSLLTCFLELCFLGQEK